MQMMQQMAEHLLVYFVSCANNGNAYRGLTNILHVRAQEKAVRLCMLGGIRCVSDRNNFSHAFRIVRCFFEYHIMLSQLKPNF